jgi:hypothetical protein
VRNLERRSGFSVLENGRSAQTAVMVLGPGEESGPLGNEHPSSPNRAAHRCINRSNERAVTFNVYAPKAY